MRKISLEPTGSSNKPTVDDELLLEHNQDSSNTNSTITRDTGKESLMRAPSKLLITLTIVAVLAGVGTGFGTFRLRNKNTEQLAAVPTTESGVAAGDEFGSKDEVFDSHAVGYIEEGGLDGEGSHKLLRAGGDSQTVFLTSSVTDLDVFVGMEVEIWGETFKGQKAGWFMDVGRVKVVNPDGQPPTEE
ncbi:MAG: hypothetical protein BroJett025_06610 [Patescibacteria group bacterium]|nr:MAG: hypothetical protein BroJett025_06610 [Patescibacteria group bacterium]